MSASTVTAPEVQIVNEALSSFAAGYRNGKYIADDVLPIVEVTKRSGTFHKFNRTDYTTPRTTAFSTEAEANEAGYSVSSGTFQVIDYGQKTVLSLAAENNAQEPHDPRERLTTFLMNILMLGREIRVADLLDNSSNYATANTSDGSNWTDETNGTPLADVHTALEAIAPGMDDDTELVMILAKEKWHDLRKHPQLRGGGALRPVLTESEAAGILGVDRIFISDSQKNTADLGASASYSRVWDTDKARIIRVPRGDPRSEVGLFGATFRHTEDEMPVTVREWQVPSKGKGGSFAIQAEFSEDVQVVQNDMGYLLTGLDS